MSSDDMLARLRQTKASADDAKAKRDADAAAQQKISMDMRTVALERWRALGDDLARALGPIVRAQDLGVKIELTRQADGFPYGAVYQLVASRQRVTASRTFTINFDYAIEVSVDQTTPGGFTRGKLVFTDASPKAVDAIVEDLVASVLKMI